MPLFNQIYIIMAILFYLLFYFSLIVGVIFCIRVSVVDGLTIIASSLIFLFMGGVLSYLKRIADKIDRQKEKPVSQEDPEK